MYTLSGLKSSQRALKDPYSKLYSKMLYGWNFSQVLEDTQRIPDIKGDTSLTSQTKHSQEVRALPFMEEDLPKRCLPSYGVKDGKNYESLYKLNLPSHYTLYLRPFDPGFEFENTSKKPFSGILLGEPGQGLFFMESAVVDAEDTTFYGARILDYVEADSQVISETKLSSSIREWNACEVLIEDHEITTILRGPNPAYQAVSAKGPITPELEAILRNPHLTLNFGGEEASWFSGAYIFRGSLTKEDIRVLNSLSKL